MAIQRLDAGPTNPTKGVAIIRLTIDGGAGRAESGAAAAGKIGIRIGTAALTGELGL